MCGILGVYANAMSDDVIRNLYNLFFNQKNRGTRGAGISINNDMLVRFRAHDPYQLFNIYNKHIWDNIRNGSRVIFHHRFPTSTVNEPKFNHPIANEDNTIHIIHNGVLWNTDDIYNQLKKKHNFETLTKKKKEFTDSEIIVHVFEDGLKKGSVKEALKYIYNKLSGSFAVALQIKGDDNIYLIKHSNPIVISKDDKGNFYFSSEYEKSNGLTKITELEEGEIGMLTAKGYEKITKMKCKPVKYVYFTDDKKEYGMNKTKFVDHIKDDDKQRDFRDFSSYDYGYGYGMGNEYNIDWKNKWG